MTIIRLKYRKIFFLGFLVAFYQSIHSESLVFPPYGHSHGIRKATQVHLSLFLPFAHFDNPEGMATAKMVARDDTTTEKDDDELIVYGVNSAKHQIVYNTSMWSLDVYGKKGNGKDQFKNPKGICCDAYGNVYVADAGNNRIVHLFNSKKKVKWVKTFSGDGNGMVGLRSPAQIGIDASGFIYVTDEGNQRIILFDSFGMILKIMTGCDTARFSNGPTTLAIADGKFYWSYFKNERLIFCADKNGKRLWKIDFNGNVLKTIQMPLSYTANYAAVDYYHNVWVTDKNNHCILKFDHDLNLLDVFGSYGKEDNQFIEPRGIAIWKRFGQAFIAENSGAQYFWIGTDVKSKNLQMAKNKITIHLQLTEHSFVSLFLPQKKDTLFLLKQQFINPGSSSTTIPALNETQLSHESVILRIEPTYSSYSYRFWDFPLKMEKNDK